MNIIQITPGAGGMFCGNCFRDNALVGALRQMGHHVVMVPLYLPMTLDEPDASAGTPIFFSGVNVYLEQKSALFRNAPGWLHRALASPSVLNWAAGRAARTRAQDVGEITLSMLRGEEGHQVRELDELLSWLKTQPKPDVICLSNALLIGLARKLKSELGARIVCMLQGEDSFLDALPDAVRKDAWRTLAGRAADADLFIAPSRYYGERMTERLGLPEARVKVVYNGINLAGYEKSEDTGFWRVSSGIDAPGSETPVLGYFARMCREKGLDLLVEAFILLRQRDRARNLKLRVGGGCGPADEPFVKELRATLKAHGLLGEATFHPNLDRAAKQAFYRSLSVFSVPALYGEAFGLYVIEAMASGVPVVQPRHGAFPELLEATRGGMICEPTAEGLANSIEWVLKDPIGANTFRESGRKAVFQQFSMERMAENVARLCQEVRP